MFLKRIRVAASGKRYTYWALVKSIRTARGPRHQVVAYLGELHPSEKAGWAYVARIVNHRPEPCLPLFGTAESAEPVPEKIEIRVQRFDCKQVCIGLVVTREGLPVGYEVFEGNRHDSKTLQEIIEAMENKHGKARRIWVLDRGMVSDQNLQFLRDRGAQYIVGTPKSALRSFEQALLQEDWTEVEKGVEVKLRPGPHGDETFILCRSTARREKEKAMHERFEKRIEEALISLAGRLDRAKKKPDRTQVERQIGRILGKNSRAAGLFDVQVAEIERGGVSGLLKVTWTKHEDWRQWAQLSEGCYLLRTNLTGWSPEDLWKTYIQLTQAESAFRTKKTELNLRPIWHHLQARVQAHILFSFLAYAMWKTLEQWMAQCGLGNAPRPVIEEFERIKTNDVILPTSTGREIRIRCVTKPDESQRILLSRLGLTLPARLGEPTWGSQLPM